MTERVNEGGDAKQPEAIDLSHASEIAQSTATGQAKTPSADELSLERFGHDLHDVEDEDMEDDDDDDEHDHVANHPFLGMLAGRLGQPRRRGSSHKYDALHPVTSVLGYADVDSCVQLEESFPPEERAAREKFEYRLSRCPELSLGVLSQPTKSEASSTGKPSKKKLVAMLVATRTRAPAVTDASMDYPRDWKTQKSTLPQSDQDEPLGHQDTGGTIAIHSLVVAPEHRNKGLATILLRSYIQRIKDSKIADRIALLAHEELVPFYKGFSFEDMGPSSCTFGGGGWTNMVLELSDMHDE